MVWKDDKLLLIERKKLPYGFAVPAGHVDGDATFEIAAKRELKEEVGLEATELKLIDECRRENPCRRQGGTWHQWRLYEAKTSGNLKRSLDETKQAGWYTIEQIKKLSIRSNQYKDGKIFEEEWQKNPGLEPTMNDWFKALKII